MTTIKQTQQQPVSDYRLLALFGVFGLPILIILAIAWQPATPAYFQIIPLPKDRTPARYVERFISFNNTPTVHAPTITQRNDQQLIAAWYAGTREGAKDVVIHSRFIDKQDQQLGPLMTLATVNQTAKDTQQYIRKLGNPILHRLPDGRLMLVYVSVSFGGWAASRLVIRFSSDGGLNWTAAKRLITSPAANLSTLVRARPIHFDNGDIGIPTYHELIGKFGELLILTPHGEIKNKRRLSWGRAAIQPTLVPLSSYHAIALLRDSAEQDKRIQLTHTIDGAKHWSPIQALKLPNPNASIAAIGLDNHQVLQVFNNDEEERNNLSLAYSANQGKTWQVIFQFENDPLVPGKKIKYSYPYLMRDTSGGFHLVYTWRKSRIKYVYFNQAWLWQQL